MIETNDFELRAAFHEQILKPYHSDPEALVIDELGLLHGRKRIDIAVLNGSFHGYEIKSSKDNLKRLESQLSVYVKCMEKLSIIASPNHIKGVLEKSPRWCGIIQADKQSTGEIHFSTVRNPMVNDAVDPFTVAHLLWKSEALKLLHELGYYTITENHNRKSLYKFISDSVNLKELNEYIKEVFLLRENWRPAL